MYKCANFFNYCSNRQKSKLLLLLVIIKQKFHIFNYKKWYFFKDFDNYLPISFNSKNCVK